MMKVHLRAVTQSLAARLRPALPEIQILFNKLTPPLSPTNARVVDPWLAGIEQATEGRVRIVTPVRNMAPPHEQLKLVTSGRADGAFQLNLFLEHSHPLLQIGFLPGIKQSAEADAVALWRTYQKYFAPKRPFVEAKLLGFFCAPAGHIYNIDKTPIQSLRDLKDKKVWSLPGSPARTVTCLGAAAVPGPAIWMHQIISNGAVDAFSCVEYADLETYDVLQYVGAATEIEGGLFSAQFCVFFGNAKWREIAPRDQDAIMEISGEALARRSSSIDAQCEAVKQRYLAQGGIVVPATPAFNAEIKQAWAPLIDQWIESANQQGVDGRAALDFYLTEAKTIAKRG
jgi:TRAP-type C4-dicarboxylate transport system substrate-binding protein